MPTLICEECGEVLGGADGYGILVSRFPQDLLNSYFHLLAGPSALPCKRCAHVTRFSMAQLVVGPDTKAVLYIPDDVVPSDPTRDNALLHIVSKLRNCTDETGLAIARDRKGFRRAFLQSFIAPAAHLANEFWVSSGPTYAWVEQHEDELNEAFFAAQWLLSSDAVPTFQVPGDTLPTSSFIPHEQAPADANHVVKRRKTGDEIAQRAGAILGWIMTIWAMRTFEARSFDRWCDAASRLIKPPSLSDLVLAGAAEHIGTRTAPFEFGKPGAILGRYVFEATLAILCCEHGRPNPRVNQWTQILLLYEYYRRVDGNDESMLLPAELVRRTLDEPKFWSGIRAIGRNIGPLNESTASQYDHLIETVRRLFPEQARDFSRIEIEYPDDLPDAAVLEALPDQLRRAVQALPDWMMLRGILFGLQRRRSHLLEGAVGALRTVLGEAGSDMDRRLLGWRCAIEILNLAGLFAVSAACAAHARQLLDAEPATGDPELRSYLFNEIGNCHRYSGEFVEALQCYDTALTLWGRKTEDRDTRVVLRNRAIVLRGLHRYAEAREDLAALRPLAHDVELMGLVASEALCLSQMGESAQALALLESHNELIAATSTTDKDARSAALLQAQLLLERGRVAEARNIASSLAAVGERLQDPISQAAAATVLLNSISDDLSATEQTQQRRRAISVLQSALDSARAVTGMPDVLVGITAALDDALVADSRASEAEPLLRKVLDDADPVLCSTAWLLALKAFRHATRRADTDQAARDLIHGLFLLGTATWNVAAEGDPVALLAPNAEAVIYLTSSILDSISAASPTGAAGLRIAADLRAAPLLTPRLRRLAGLLSPVADMAGEAARLDRVLQETPCVVLQFVSLASDVGMLVTQPGDSGASYPEFRRLGLDPESVRRVASRLDYAFSRADPDATQLEMMDVRGWMDLRERLRGLVIHLPRDLPLCVVPGPLSSTIISFALGEERSLCFVPSVGALLAMRARRRTLAGGLRWRPKSLFAFATWFERERAKQVTSLTRAVESVGAVAEVSGLSFVSGEGADATAESLLGGLTTADLTYVACHGRILPESESVDLIVAADGRLPPNDLGQLVEERRMPHVLGWQRLANLPSASTVVLSSACNSGLAVLHAGGERLGLGRPLFSAGTLAYLAPQWPVPTVAIQTVAVALLEDWLSTPERSLAASVAWQRAAALSNGISPLAAKAFAVFGDGL